MLCQQKPLNGFLLSKHVLMVLPLSFSLTLLQGTKAKNWVLLRL